MTSGNSNSLFFHRIRLTVSWNDSSVVTANYDGDCDNKVVAGLDDMARIWTPDVYIYNAIDTVCDMG